jgi:integrase
MEITPSQITFVLIDTIKQSRRGFRTPDLVFRKYPVDARLCVYRYLSGYLERTLDNRGQEKYLLLSFRQPFHKVSSDTIRRWTKDIMSTAGIDISRFQAHSTRAASTSAAARAGVSVKEIMLMAGWTQTSTFGKYYNKVILDKKKLKYDTAVLKSKK